MKNFGFYFKKGFVLTKKAMQGKSVFTKLLLGLYLILSFFGKLFLFLRPIFIIADTNLAMMIVECQDFELNKLFEGVNSKKRYSSLLLSNLYIEGIILSAIITLVVPFLVWGIIPLHDQTLHPFIFVAIFSVLVLALALALMLIYSPIGYVTVKGKDLNSGDILYLAKEGSSAVRGKVFGICFLDYFFLLLIMGAFIGVPLLVANLVTRARGGVFPGELFVAIVLVLVAFIIVNLFLLTIFRLSVKVSLYSIFFDNAETKHIVIAKKDGASDEYSPLFSDDKEE